MSVAAIGLLGFIACSLAAHVLAFRPAIDLLVTSISGIIAGVVSAGIFALIMEIRAYEKNLDRISSKISELADILDLAIKAARCEDWIGLRCSVNTIVQLSREIFNEIEPRSRFILTLIQMTSRYRCHARRKPDPTLRMMDDQFCRFARTLLYGVNRTCVASMNTKGYSLKGEISNICKDFTKNYGYDKETGRQIRNPSTEFILYDLSRLFQSAEEKSTYNAEQHHDYICSINVDCFRDTNGSDNGASTQPPIDGMKDKTFTRDEYLKYIPTISKDDAEKERLV